MSRFGPDPLDFFNAVYHKTPPWDIGGPQPAMSALLDKYPPASPILDLGCASGDLAIFLAKGGHQVLGIDLVAAAITDAQAKAAALAPEVARRLHFQVADASKASQLGRRFGAVVDSGFYHLFDLEEGDRLVDELALSLLPGGRYYLHAFAIEFSIPNVPRGVNTEEIQTRFRPERGWQILEIRSVDFLSRVAPPVPAISACIQRLPA